MNAYRSQPSIYKFIVCLSFALSFLLVSQVGEALAQKVGTLEKVEGNVRVFAKDSKRGKKGRNGMALFVESTIKTQAGAKADIQYSNGDTFRLVDKGEVTLGNTKFNEGAIDGSINIAAGKFFYLINGVPGKTKYTMNTPSATAGIKGTNGYGESLATLTKFANENGFLVVFNPKVGGPTQTLGPNSYSVTLVNQNPSVPTPIPPEIQQIITTLGADLTQRQQQMNQQKQEENKDEDKKDEDKKDEDKKDEDKKDDDKKADNTGDKTKTDPDQSNTDLVGNVLADKEVENALANGDEDIQNKVGSPSQ